MATRRWRILLIVIVASTVGVAAYAHDVAADDAALISRVQGVALAPFAYLGAKHMVTGIDHLLYLAGVIFFLHRMRDVGVYVTLFALGHSATLLLGVAGGWNVDPHAVDAVIGLSVAYKAFENLGGWRYLRWPLDPRVAVLVFGLVHGLGLATKLSEVEISAEGLGANLLAFNLGVELGQLAALSILLVGFELWRHRPAFVQHAWGANVLLLSAGLTLFGYQMVGYRLGVMAALASL